MNPGAHMTTDHPRSHLVDAAKLPKAYPTHQHSPDFWQSLGRAVATFGFLEEILVRAIIALTATRTYSEDQIEAEYAKWTKKLERTISDPLGALIDTYGKAVQEHPDQKVEGIPDLLDRLRDACDTRNMLCHGSWGPPDRNGASLPFFVHKRRGKFTTRVDRLYLDQVQAHTTGLACEVIDTVTDMGLRFPGSRGPGRDVWNSAG